LKKITKKKPTPLKIIQQQAMEVPTLKQIQILVHNPMKPQITTRTMKELKTIKPLKKK
jgi:hypothetical protein